LLTCKGHIFGNGKNYEAGKGYGKGAIIEMIVDTLNWNITWIVNEKDKISADIQN